MFILNRLRESFLSDYVIQKERTRNLETIGFEIISMTIANINARRFYTINFLLLLFEL